jgi:hypothetical protein
MAPMLFSRHTMASGRYSAMRRCRSCAAPEVRGSSFARRQVVHRRRNEIVEVPSVGFETLKEIAVSGEDLLDRALEVPPQVSVSVVEESAADGSRLRHEQRGYPPRTMIRSCLSDGSHHALGNPSGRCYRPFTQVTVAPVRGAPSDLNRTIRAVHIADGESREVVGRSDAQRAVRRNQLRKSLPVKPARIR